MVGGSGAAVLRPTPALVGSSDGPDPLIPDDVVDAELAGVGLGVGREGVSLCLARGRQWDHEVGGQAGGVAVGIRGARAVAADGLDAEHGAEDVDQLRQLGLDRPEVVVGLGGDGAPGAAPGRGGGHERVVGELAGLGAVVDLGAGPGEVGAVDVVDRRVLLGLLAGLGRPAEGVGQLGGQGAVRGVVAVLAVVEVAQDHRRGAGAGELGHRGQLAAECLLAVSGGVPLGVGGVVDAPDPDDLPGAGASSCAGELH